MSSLGWSTESQRLDSTKIAESSIIPSLGFTCLIAAKVRTQILSLESSFLDPAVQFPTFDDSCIRVCRSREITRVTVSDVNECSTSLTTLWRS